MDLKQYEQSKFALAEIIRSSQAIDTKNTALESDCRDLLARLAEDQFNLMVVGRFSRGKSTLMNAILGGTHLPTGIVPLTSVITTVRYGSKPQVVLHFRDSGLNREIPLSELAQYVTQQGNPGNSKRVAWAEIQLPVEILRRGLFFVDTPGLGSPIIENTLTTERFLPQADAFILVTSYESPLSEEEVRILERIRNTEKKLFIVLNKQDTATPEERQQAQQFVAEQLKILLGREVAEVYSISARQALEGRIAGDAEKLEGSGLQAFEAELLRFLTEDRAQRFLLNMYERTMDLLVEWSQSADQRDKASEWDQMPERLRDHRGAITGVPGQSEPAEGTGIKPGTWTLAIDRKSGCSICGAVLEATFRFLSKYQYELTFSPDAQRELARREGFCPLHTWQYEGISSPYGVCTAYPELAHQTAAGLERIAGDDGDAAGKMRRLLATAQTCRVCEVQRDAVRKAVRDAAHVARKSAGKPARIPASCLPHLLMVAEMLGPGDATRDLLAAHANLLERTAEDLQRYALKHDALRRYLTSEEERRASQNALLLLAGHRNLSSPWVIEYIL
jgi:ribosome biogenesis GTPase A